MPVIESFYVSWCYSVNFGWLPSPCSSLEYHRWGWALLLWLLMGNNTKAGLDGNGVGGGIAHISSAEVVQRTVWLLPGWPSFCSSYQFPTYHCLHFCIVSFSRVHGNIFLQLESPQGVILCLWVRSNMSHCLPSLRWSSKSLSKDNGFKT